MSTLFHTKLNHFIQSKHSWDYWAVTITTSASLNELITIWIWDWKLSLCCDWNPRGKLLMDNEGLWWLKLVPGSTCVGCGGKIVSLLSSASDNIMPGPGLYRLNCQSLAAVITINSVLEQIKNLCLEVFFLAKLRKCVSVVVTILMVKRIPVKNSEWI